MRRSRFLVYTLTGALGLALCNHAQAETLREAVLTALANHPSVDIAKAQKDIASEEENEQYSNLFPYVSANATGGRIFQNNATSRGTTTSRGEAYSWLWEGGGSVTQPIFDGFETYDRIKAAKSRENAADLTLTDAREGLALRAAQAYYNVMRAKEAHAKAASYREKIADYVSRIDSMVESGAGDDTESAQAKNIQSQLDNTVAEMEGQVKLALADYNEVVGQLPVGDLKDTDDAAPALFKDVTDAVGYGTQNHPLVLSAQKTMDAEDKEVSAEKGTLLPDLSGELSYLKRDQKEDIGGEFVDGRAVMHLNWGFATGGADLARIRKAKAERSEALARIAQTKRNVERDIRRAYAEYETAEKQKELSTKRADVTKNLFDTYEKQFEASKVRILQVMQAENQVFTTQLEQINADYRVKLAEYNVLASAGRLLDVLNVADKDAASDVAPAAGLEPMAETMERRDGISTEPAIETVSQETPQVEIAPAAATKKESIYPAEDYPVETGTKPSGSE